MNTKKDQLRIIANGLAGFFKDDPTLITHWLMTPNPNFGGIAPAYLMMIRENGGEKVARFVEASLGENQIPQRSE